MSLVLLRDIRATDLSVIHAINEAGTPGVHTASPAELAAITRVSCIALVAQIVALYFERRRLLVERELTGAPDLVAELRILEIEALLDALTEGRFGQALRGAAEAEE